MKYSSGEEYDGKWKNGVKEGNGVFNYPDGTVYNGQWKNDYEEGIGILIEADNNVYETHSIQGAIQEYILLY